MGYDLQTQLRFNPYTPMKHALRTKILISLGNRVGCMWAKASTIRELSEDDRYFEYIFSDTDAIPVDQCICLTEEDNRRFSVWETEDAKLQCRTEFDLAPQSVRDLFDNPSALDEYATEIAYFYGFISRKHIEPPKTAFDSLQNAFPGICLETFLEISSYMNYLLRPEEDDILHIFRLKFGRETIALNVLAILNHASLFSKEGKTVDESLRDWLSCKEDNSISTRAQIAAVMECPIEKVNSIIGVEQSN